MYTGIKYENTVANRYQYKLEGYLPQLIEAGTERKAVYTNLAPGKYTFLVKAANADGVWNVYRGVLNIIHGLCWLCLLESDGVEVLFLANRLSRRHESLRNLGIDY